MSTALRSVGLLDVLSSTSAGPLVARLVSTPVCAASLRNLVRKAGFNRAAAARDHFKSGALTQRVTDLQIPMQPLEPAGTEGDQD